MACRILSARDQVEMLSPWRVAADDDPYAPGPDWFHASPYELAPGTMLIPRGGKTTWNRFYNTLDPQEAREIQNHVWLDRNINISRSRAHGRGHYIYRVEPSTEPQELGLPGGGHCTDSAIIQELVEKTPKRQRNADRRDPHHGDGPWFHGTNAELIPGATLMPGDTVGKAHGKFSDGTRVWVSNDPVRASAYGSRLYEVFPHARPRSPYANHDEHYTTGADVIREISPDDVRDWRNTYDPSKGWHTASAEDYRGQHQGPDPEYGASLHNVEMMFPDYYQHPEYYRTYQPYDHQSESKILKYQGRPDARVDIYRALPMSAATTGFGKNMAFPLNRGDWVTTSYDYAKEHGESNLDQDGPWTILHTKAPASQLFTEGNSIHEWAYQGDDQLALEHPTARSQRYRRTRRSRTAAPRTRFTQDWQHIGDDYIPLDVISGYTQRKDTGFGDEKREQYERIGRPPLSEQIREHGYEKPVELCTDGRSGSIYDGHHRIDTARALGHSHVPVRVTWRKPNPDGTPMFGNRIDPWLKSWLTDMRRGRQTARLAMAWDEWAPKIQHFPPGRPGGKGFYSVDHGNDITSDVSYTPDHGRKTLDVGLLAVNKRFQGDGVAEALIRRMVQDHPGYKINTGFMTPEGQAFHDRMLNKEPDARGLVNARLAAVTQDLVDRLQDEFNSWWGETGHKMPRAGSGLDRGPLGHWPNIENFLGDTYPAAYRGHEMGMEEAGHILDGHKPTPYMEQNLVDSTPYETGPDTLAYHGYDPKEVAAAMLLLHNQSHPLRGDMLQRDQDRLTDIFTKRQQMQRAYENRQAPVTARVSRQRISPQKGG